MARKVNNYYPKLLAIKFIRALLPIALKFQPSSPDPEPKPSAIKYYTCQNRRRKIHVYLPQPAIEGPLPINVNLHGAGFCLPTFGDDAYFCSLVANQVGCVVLDVDHSKGVEDPWPSAIEDIEAAIAWARDNASNEGWDASRITISGFSSGGCLALVAGSSPANQLKGIAAFYPSTNLAEDPNEKPKVKPSQGQAGGAIPPPVRRLFYACYVHRDQDKSDPRISPLHANAQSFAPTTIITCGGDSLAREGRQLVDKLKAAGKDVVHYEAEGQGHGWDHQIKNPNSEAGKMREHAYNLAITQIKAYLQV